MAQRRMFSREITASDLFVDMPQSTQLLYFHLGMEADDEGFIGNAKMLSRAYGANGDDLKLLVAKGFLLVFESGVSVIRDWHINNQLRKDRIKETFYTEERAQIENNNGVYQYVNQLKSIPQPNDNHLSTNWQPNDNQPSTSDCFDGGQMTAHAENVDTASVQPLDNHLSTKCQPTVRIENESSPNRLGKDRLVEDRLGKDRLDRHDACAREENEIATKSDSDQNQNPVGQSSSDNQDFFEFFQKANMGVINAIVYEKVESDLNEFGETLVRRAIETAAMQNKQYTYAQGILRNWAQRGLKTIADVEQAESVRNARAKPNRYGRSPRIEEIPEWINTDDETQSTDSQTSDEGAQVAFQGMLSAFKELNAS